MCRSGECGQNRERQIVKAKKIQVEQKVEAGRRWTANHVPFVRLAAKEEEEEDEAREEVREKRRGTCVSLAAGSKGQSGVRVGGRDREREKESEGRRKGEEAEEVRKTRR